MLCCVSWRDEASGDGIKRAEERSSRPAPGRGDRYSKDRDRGSSYRDKNPKTEDAKEEATKASTDSKSTDSKSAESESAAEATA